MTAHSHAPLMPAITVNGVTIPSALIGAEAQNHPAPDGKPGLAWRAAARALATRELLLQEARVRGIAAVPAELAQGQLETADEATIRALLEAALPAADLDESRLRAIYDAAPDRFRAPSLYEAAHILFAAPDGDAPARAAARAEAEAVLADLRRNPRRFAELAAAHSACPSRANGGMLGQLSPGDTVPEFEAAMDALKDKEFSAVVQSPFGMHLIQVIERRQRDVSEERKRATARQALRERKLDDAYQDWLRQIRDRAYVEIRLEEK